MSSYAANKHHSSADAGERNYTMMQAFEWYTPKGGVHWNWLKDNAARFASMGITALWIPPPTKTASQDSTGYDIYDLWDLGEFPKNPEESQETRTKYGTRKDLEECIKALRENDISVYFDVVLNHRMGADGTEVFKAQQVADDDRKKKIGEPHDIEGWTKFTFPGRKGKYSEFQYNFNHFTGVDYDNKTGDKGVFQILGTNKGFADDVDEEKGGFDYLMGADVEHAHPKVAEDCINWGRWIVREFDISGIRLDAVKHISRDFISDFVKAVRDEARKKRKDAGKPEIDETEGPIMFSVGEYWKDSVETCMDYLNSFGDHFSLFDAPLHANFAEAGHAGKEYDLRKIFDQTIVKAHAPSATTLVTNHDTQEGQSLANPVSASFKPMAYAIILLREEGYPCVFLGDLEGTKGDDSQPATEPMSDLAKLIKIRSLFAFGEQRDYWDHPSCVGWVRMGSEEHPHRSATVLCVGEGEGSKRMEVGKDQAGKVYVDAMGWMPDAKITVGDDGWVEFKSPPNSIAVWVEEGAKGLEDVRKL